MGRRSGDRPARPGVRVAPASLDLFKARVRSDLYAAVESVMGASPDTLRLMVKALPPDLRERYTHYMPHEMRRVLILHAIDVALSD